MFKENAFKVIFFEEGFREKPYYCTEGYPTIGIGRVVGKKGEKLPNITTTLEREQQYLNDWIDRQESVILSHPTLSGAWRSCNEDRKAILLSMVYQLGLNGAANFKKFVTACTLKDWQEAKSQMLDSKAARQTPNRFKRQSDVILSGSIKGIY